MRGPGTYREIAHGIRQRLRLPGCRVVVSFPKSGRTQVRVMLHAAGVACAYSHGGSSDEQGRRAGDLVSGPRYWRRCRVLFMIRDPLDTVVSAWFHARYRSRVYEGEFPAFLRDPRYGLEKIVLFHLLWLERRADFRAFALLEYEALQRDPAGELRRAASFLSGRLLPDALVREAVEAGSFGAMRALERSGAGAELFGLRLSPGDADRPESFKTRRGVVGGWRDHFSPDDIDFAEELFERHDYRRRLRQAGATPPGPSRP